MKKAEQDKHQTEIFEYIRRRKNGKTIKVGIILGTVIPIQTSPDPQTIKIGWSKCNIKLGDEFNVKQGLELARARAYGETPTTTPTPNCIRRQVRQFGSRAVRYFQDAHKLELPV